MRYLALTLALAVAAPAIAQEQAPAPTMLDLSVPLTMDVELLAGAQRALGALAGQKSDVVDKALAQWAAQGLAEITEQKAKESIKQEKQRQANERDPEVAVWLAFIKYRVALDNLAEHRKLKEKEKAAAEAKAKVTPAPSPPPTPAPEKAQAPK